MKKYRLLIGGSPCTHWSIAQKNNRETEPSGIGWELFKNFLIAKEKFKPDYFLYENNKSAAQPIKEQISKELRYPLQYINSALVSAQNRERFYCHNIPNVPMPEDRGILLKDILESGVIDKEKSYCLKHQAGNARDYFKKHHTQIAYEPLRIGDIGSNAQAHRVYSSYGKSVTINAGGGQGGKTGLCAVPITYPIRKNSDVCITDKSIRCVQRDKKKSSVAESFCYFDDVKCGTLTTAHIPMTMQAINFVDGKTYPVYIVKSGLITINGKQYPIKLPDGYYIIRKLTVLECKRLQTVRDDYIFPVSDTQAYKMLGNGWTVDVISHILNYIPDIQNCEVEVLSMYDGMSCGNLALEKTGCKVGRYVSYEIDKYAIKTTQTNFPFVEQRGDAFQIRNEDWLF